MSKAKIVVAVLVTGLLLVSLDVFAGGRDRVSSSDEQIGVPPEAMVRVSNIARHRGKGELFYPALDLGSRITNHYIEAGDKRPGPGWGVPEGHNIGNAPQPPVIGKVLDRSGRGDGGPVKDFLRRIKQHHAEHSKGKGK